MTPVGWLFGGLGVGVALIIAKALVHSPPPTPLDTAAGAGHAPPGWTPVDYLDAWKLGNDIGSSGPDLLLIMESESNLNPGARFPKVDAAGHSIATGLTQLTAASDPLTGLSEAQRDSFSSLPVASQLPIIRRYMENTQWGKEHRPYPSAGALYALNFLPARALERGIAPQTVLGTVEEFPLDKGLADSAGHYTVASLNAELATIAQRPRYLAALQAMRDAVGDQALSPRLPK
jgi:hypothetical protein